MFLRRKGENAPQIPLFRSASPFPRPAPDFSTRREKNLRNFPAPLFACKSILYFVQCENNILPSVLKRGFLQRSLIKISAFENSRPRPSSLSRPCRPPSAALILHATHRSSRAFSLSPVPPQHPRLPVFRAIYEAGGRRAERMVSFRREVVGFAERRRPNFVRCGRCCADRLTAAGNRFILLLSLAAVTFERGGQFNDSAGIRIQVSFLPVRLIGNDIPTMCNSIATLSVLFARVAQCPTTRRLKCGGNKKIMEKTLCVQK